MLRAIRLLARPTAKNVLWRAQVTRSVPFVGRPVPFVGRPALTLLEPQRRNLASAAQRSADEDELRQEIRALKPQIAAAVEEVNRLNGLAFYHPSRIFNLAAAKEHRDFLVAERDKAEAELKAKLKDLRASDPGKSPRPCDLPT